MKPLIKPFPPVPKGIKDAAQLRKLVIFVGAGVSVRMGCPNWDGFAKMCKICQRKARKPSENQIISRYVPSLLKRTW